MKLRDLIHIILTPLQPGEAAWRREHIVAHLLGGMGIALIARGPWFNFNDTVLHRLVWVAALQGFWEWLQVENWRLPNGQADYPYWSAGWDLLFAVLGWSVVELVLGLM